MNLDKILATVKNAYKDVDISFLCDQMAAGKLDVRTQLADAIATRPATLPPLMHLEISHWGINDDLSQCSEINKLRIF